MLEYFIHLDKDDPPADLVLAIAEVPRNFPRDRVEIPRLPANWRDSPAPAELARWGDEFAREARHCILLVPSVLAPREFNCLINPAYTDFKKIAVQDVEPLSFDPRMFRERRRRNRRA